MDQQILMSLQTHKERVIITNYSTVSNWYLYFSIAHLSVWMFLPEQWRSVASSVVSTFMNQVKRNFKKILDRA